MQSSEDRAFTEKEAVVIDEEIAAINRQLLELENGTANPDKTGNQPHNRADKVDIRKAIGLQQYETSKINEPIFLKASKIKASKRDLSKVILSGMDLLDKRIIGFNPGELSIWSGSNGSGKSSILSQIAIEGVNQNFNIALFSGELRADRVLSWLHLQATGKRYVKPTQYDNFFTVTDEIKRRINTWLDSSLYIYNNDYGTRVESVLLAIKECIERQHISMVIIDNMMSLDLASVGGEKYEKQTSLVLALCELAKQSNVHIHFVAHPRKSLGFLRKNDISGTADITNACDNVFIVHRVNADFKRTTKQDLGLKEDNSLYRYSNVIEVCKNRDLGVSDEFVGLYFEKESKRFLNHLDEHKHYNWEADKDGFIKCEDKSDLPFERR